MVDRTLSGIYVKCLVYKSKVDDVSSDIDCIALICKIMIVLHQIMCYPKEGLFIVRLFTLFLVEASKKVASSNVCFT